jgi:NADH-quinone oxidoreductase subunit J
MHFLDSIHSYVFLVFSGIALISASMVIMARNPVRAVLCLILTFISTAGTWLMLDAEFLAITLVLVYVGAVMVLFLFVVMMLDIDFATVKAQFTKWLVLGIALTVSLFLLLMHIIDKDHFELGQRGVSLAYGTGASNVAMLGNLIFNKYLLQFEIAGVLLLVAIIAAIGLIYRGPRDRKTQNVAVQIQAKASKRVRLVEGI